MNSSGSRPPWFVWMIFGGLGVIFLGLGLWFFFREMAFGNRALAVQGTVVDFVESRGKSGLVYAPVVEFTAGDQTVRFKSSLASSPRSYDVGDPVPVLYEPARPEEATIDSFVQRYLVSSIFILMGLIFSGVGVGLFFSRSARR